MQLLDSKKNQPGADPDRLQNELQDIASKIEIESTFCIRHPDYKPLELTKEAIARFQHLPAELQTKYLSAQLCSFLYGIYYNGYLRTSLAPDSDSESLAQNQNLENNSSMGVDLEFYDRLHQSNNGEGYFSSDWLVVKEEADGALAVQKSGLTLYIERERHLHPTQQGAKVGESVAIRLPRNLVQNGFYMAVGNVGQSQKDVVRVYFNLSPEGAVAMMSSLTTLLNTISIPFSFKALYNPSDYTRFDSAVLYLEKSDYEVVYPELKKVYTQHQAHFLPQVPLFTKLLAPGLALAEEPNNKFSEKESFGTNRCQIVTNGLLEAWQQADNSPEYRMAKIREQFSLQGIELQRPYLNANSEDIYQPL